MSVVVDMGAFKKQEQQDKMLAIMGPKKDEPKPKKVFICSYPHSGYHNMYAKREDYEITMSLEDADLIQFCGGIDVAPSLYGQICHKETNYDLSRDRSEAMIYRFAYQNLIPMAGICRGAQFLNVMCGGDLYQHVDNHRSGGHPCFDLIEEKEFVITSTHHQMMCPGKGALIIAEAYQSTMREKIFKAGHNLLFPRGESEGDPEVLYYPYSKVFCFQGHPEFTGDPKLTDIYFEYLDNYLFEDGWEDCELLT